MPKLVSEFVDADLAPRPPSDRLTADVASPVEIRWLHEVRQPAQPLVEPPAQFLARLRATPMPQVVPPLIPVLRRPRRVSHRKWHQPLTVGQGSRGTCWAFAGVAALEAAYARSGTQVKLSEHYLFHIIKAHENQAQGNTNHSLMDFGGGAGVLRLMRHCALPRADLARYIDAGPLKKLADQIPQTGGALSTSGSGSKDQADWLEYDLRHIPAAARWASSYRVAGHGTVPATLDDIRNAIAAGWDVTVDVNDKVNNGGHVILIIGYDDDAKAFEIKNSQATPGFGTMAYAGDAQFDLIPNSTAYYVSAVAPVAPQWAAMWIGRWQTDHDGWLGRLVIRRFTNIQAEGTDLPPPDRPIPLGTWYGDNGRFEVISGGFTDSGRGLVLTIGGQKFELWVHGHEPSRAGGRCWWNGTAYGAVLTRGPTLGAGSGFDRSETIGLWDMVHDGWRGQLRIGANPGYVQAQDGAVRPATIAPAPVAHKVDATIDFGTGPQPFALLAHTREDGVFGGTTTWGGQTWPVEGRMSSNLYTITDDGTLRWYRHTGRARRVGEWDGPKVVGSGWNVFRKVFGGADGVIYGIRPDGRLSWYYHDGRNQGTVEWRGPLEVGSGWNGFRHVVAAGGGVVYAITADGRLLWYRHLGRRDGAAQWLGPVEVGSGWAEFRAVMAGADGCVYGVAANGELYWYRHDGADHGFPIWQGPVRVGTGWSGYPDVWVAGNGFIYGRNPAGELWAWRHHGFRTGQADWAQGVRVGTGWRAGIREVFVT